MKKYELVKEQTVIVDNKTLFRIKALKDFSDVKKDDLGGYVQSENNLSQDGNCWIYDNAKVYDNAIVYGNAKIIYNAQIFDSAQVFDNANVSGWVKVYNNAKIFEYAVVYYRAQVFDNAQVHGNSYVYDYSKVYGNAQVYDNGLNCIAQICGKAEVYGNAKIFGKVKINGKLININDVKKVNKIIKNFNNFLISEKNEIINFLKSHGYTPIINC